MEKIIGTVVMLGLVVGLIAGVIMPMTNQVKNSGSEEKMDAVIDTTADGVVTGSAIVTHVKSSLYDQSERITLDGGGINTTLNAVNETQKQAIIDEIKNENLYASTFKVEKDYDTSVNINETTYTLVKRR